MYDHFDICPVFEISKFDIARLSQNLSYIEVVFHSQKLVFRFFTTTCVELNFVLVKNLNNMNVKTK